MSELEENQQRLELSRRPLSCKLTRDEMFDIQKRLGEKLGKLEVHEFHEKEVKARLKAEKEALAAEVSMLASISRSGEEERLVEVATVADFDTKEILEVRLDTEEVVARRKMTDSERQQILIKPEGAEEIDGEGDEIGYFYDRLYEAGFEVPPDVIGAWSEDERKTIYDWLDKVESGKDDVPAVPSAVEEYRLN